MVLPINRAVPGDVSNGAGASEAKRQSVQKVVSLTKSNCFLLSDDAVENRWSAVLPRPRWRVLHNAVNELRK